MTATDWFEIGIILVLILVVAFNAATEVAITRTNRVRALRLVEEGRRGAVALSRIARITEPKGDAKMRCINMTARPTQTKVK